MRVIDTFWATPEQKLAPEVIAVMICYNAIILFYLFIQYILIKNKMKHSMSGPLQIQESETGIFGTLRFFYGTLILIEVSVFVVLISGLLTRGGKFLFGGFHNIFFIFLSIANILIINNVTNQFYKETDQDGDYSTNILYLLIVIASTSVIILSVIEYHLLLLISAIILLGLFLYLLSLQYVRYLALDIDNPVIKRRLLLLFATNILSIILLILYFNIRIIEIELSSSFFEYYLIVVNFFAIGSGSMFSIFVYLPFWFRKITNLSDDKYYNNLDYRFDYNWNITERKVEILQNRYELPTHTNTKYLLAYINKDDQVIFQELQDTYSGEIIHIRQISEETLKVFGLPNRDILFIDTNYSKMTQKFMKYLKEDFYFDISFKDYKIEIDNKYVISSVENEFIYALLLIYPPNWNVSRKLWHVLFPPNLASHMIDFLVRYKSYFETISVGRIIITILRFPISGGQILPIPPSPKAPFIPDHDFVNIL